MCKCAIGQNNPVIKEKAKNFYWWLDTMSPVACDVVADDLGGAPSKRWMHVINSMERAGMSHIYMEGVSDIVTHMESAINKWKIDSQHRILFSLAIDAIKVAEGIDISSSSKSIIRNAYPHQLISTIDKDSELTKKIVDQDTDSRILFYKASEAKL